MLKVLLTFAIDNSLIVQGGEQILAIPDGQ